MRSPEGGSCTEGRRCLKAGRRRFGGVCELEMSEDDKEVSRPVPGVPDMTAI